MASEVVSVRFSAHQIRLVRAAAKRLGISVSEFVRQAIRKPPHPGPAFTGWSYSGPLSGYSTPTNTLGTYGRVSMGAERTQRPQTHLTITTKAI